MSNFFKKLFSFLFTAKVATTGSSKQYYSMDTKLNSFDSRDILQIGVRVSEVTDPTIPILDTVTRDMAILNQGQYGTCPNYDVVRQMKRYWFFKNGVEPDFSARFLVIMSKMIDGLPNTQGTQPRFPMNIAVNVGCCTTALLPDNTTLPWSEYSNPKYLTPAVLAEAAKWKMPAYATFNADILSLRLALTSCKAVGITVPVGGAGSDFSGSVAGGLVKAPTVIDQNTQYHRITLYADTPDNGDHDSGFVNQWGAGWGNGGKGVFKFSDFAGKIYDVMAFSEDIPQILIDKAKTSSNMQNMNMRTWCAAVMVFEGFYPGTQSWLNNNPGNLRFVGQALATNTGAADGSQFCTFKTFEDGYTALYQQIFNACSGVSKVYLPSMTIAQFYLKYTSDGAEVSANYAAFVARCLGVSVDTVISTLIA